VDLITGELGTTRSQRLHRRPATCGEAADPILRRKPR